MKKWLVLLGAAAAILGCTFASTAKGSVTNGMEVVSSMLPETEDLYDPQSGPLICETKDEADTAVAGGAVPDDVYYWEWLAGTDNDHFPDVPNAVVEQILQVNDGQLELTALSSKFAGYELLARIGDLHLVRYSDGSYHHGYVDDYGNLTNVLRFRELEATWQCDNLISGAEIRVIHYSNVTNSWEFITPQSLNVSGKTVTASFTDLSPIGLVYRMTSSTGDSSASGSSSSGADGATASSSDEVVFISPKTGQGYRTELLLVLGAACIMAAAYIGLRPAIRRRKDR
ncbi:MAG: hypothetical protein LIO86_10740 [Lachnospiraceae bacterium]|nr:hypothetical protein [Lachnospiraceae bacterium]